MGSGTQRQINKYKDLAGYPKPNKTVKQSKVSRLEDENRKLRQIVEDTLWMARRYADGRSTYCPEMYNESARLALALGVKFNLSDEIIWARDGMRDDNKGLFLSGISQREATAGTKEAMGFRGKNCGAYEEAEDDDFREE